MASTHSLNQADATPQLEATIQRKRRHAISDAERRMIRRRAASHPGKQQQIAEWFEQETGRQLAQGKISEILGSKYEHLDADNRKDAALGSQRRSVADHPDVEGALFEWQQKIQNKRGTITGHVLKAKAHDIWVALPQKKDLTGSKWSSGWLEGFISELW
jgi:Fission yeast centromere protein N-terminal domain/Tc5 transposase DNA-binding domain